jgi:hypothetical protein
VWVWGGIFRTRVWSGIGRTGHSMGHAVAMRSRRGSPRQAQRQRCGCSQDRRRRHRDGPRAIGWDAASLDRWLADPEVLAPDRRIGYRVADVRMRADGIADLATLTAVAR